MTTAFVDATRRGGVGLRIAFIAYTGARAWLAVAATLAGLGLAWVACYAAGGSNSSSPHLFYLPIILAAVRLTWPMVVATALTAGLLAGPALPADVATGEPQELAHWLLRLAIFVLVALFLAWLTRGQHEPLRSTMQHSLTSARLMQAVQCGDVEVNYQPLYRLHDQQIVGFEALARWHDPRRGSVLPDEFVAAAERTGAVIVLDAFVLRAAAAQIQRWSAELGLPLRLSTNLSTMHFTSPDLVHDVVQALDHAGLPARALELEITESALIDNIGDAVKQIGTLRALGVRIAIDDFGSGQASLGYLNHFDVDTVKLDRSFLQQATTEARPSAVLAGVIRLLRDLDVEIVVEGVESDDQLAVLRDLGVHLGQGFHLGQPLTALDAEHLLRSISASEA
ncbi:hypothetical protein JCM18899A_21530 [Nocardioides sp. AN3]